MIVNYDGDVHKDYYYWVEAETPAPTKPATPAADSRPCQCPRHKQTAGRSLLAEVEEMERAAASEMAEWAEFAAAADAERLAWWNGLTPAEQDAHIDALEEESAVWGAA